MNMNIKKKKNNKSYNR